MKRTDDSTEIKTNQLVSTLFDENLSFSYVCKKTEKLTSALHLVTDVIDKEEPVCRLLRSSGLSILSYIILLGTQVDQNTTDRIKSNIVKTVSLLGVSYRSGFISEANHTLLEAEYIELGIFVDTHRGTFMGGSSTGVLKELLDVPYPKRLSVEKKSIQSFSQGQLKRQNNLVVKKPNGVRHSERRDIIIQLLGKKDKITVKDISKEITDCSEKTLQRELISLVEEGVLKKEGERRWSTYFLAK